MQKLLEKISIKNRISMLILFTVALFFVVSGIISSIQFKESLVKDHITEMSTITETAVGLVNSFYQDAKTGKLSEKEAKNLAKKAIQSMRYDGENYIWINDYSGTMIMHPLKPELNGQNVFHIKDAKGKELFVEATKIAKEKGHGELDYYWTKPGTDKNLSFPKMSYVRDFKPWGWVIGSGVYIDEIDHKVLNTMLYSLGTNIIVAILIVLIANATIGKSIISPIQKLSNLALQLAKNDLTIEVPEDNNKTEIGDLNRSFKTFVDSFSQLIKEVKDSVENVAINSQEISVCADQTVEGAEQITKSIVQLSDGSSQISHSVSQLAIGAKEISKYVEEGVGNINAMNTTIQTISKDANSIASLASNTELNANEGSKELDKAINKIGSIKHVASEVSLTINELGRLGSEIEQIVDLIKGIASQTNLLALNAAIEAARAGEHGKGFAVVAEEVKKLAGQSSEATDKITGMIKEIQNKTELAVESMDKAIVEVEDGVYTVNKAGKSLESIISQVREANKNLQTVNKDIGGVASNSLEIVSMVEKISAITEQTAASAEEISSVTEEAAASAEEISSITEEQTSSLGSINESTKDLVRTIESLKEQIAVFKVEDEYEDVNTATKLNVTQKSHPSKTLGLRLAS